MVVVLDGLGSGDGNSEGKIEGVYVGIPVALLHETALIRINEIIIRMINERKGRIDRITFQ
jgi:hypothetical protein